MNTRKRLKRDFDRIEIPSKSAILPEAEQKTAAAPPRRTARRLLTAPMIAMLAILIVGCAAAGGAILHNLNFETITENTTRLTEVPEGYVGIYTKEDLVQMSRDVIDGTNAENYILMADIEFTDADFAEGGICEGGWEPIDLSITDYFHESEEIPDEYTQKSKTGRSEYIKATKYRYLSVFNGNGYVIRNLKIRADVAPPISENEYATDVDTSVGVGLFGNTSIDLQVINLGMENSEITVYGLDISPYSQYRDIRIGTIAASAAYMGSCYVNGVTINLHTHTLPYENTEQEHIDDNKIEVFIGSLVGYSDYVDACYAENYTLNISNSGHDNIYLYAGGIAGHSIACLTSWSQGDIYITGSGFYQVMQDDFVAYNYSDRIPTMIPKETYEDFDSKLAAYYGDNTFDYKRIRAYFIAKDPSKLTSKRQLAELQTVMEYWNKTYALATNQPDVKLEALYLFDPTAKPHEIMELGEEIAAVFDSPEDYREFCLENNYLAGGVCCYAYTAEDIATEKNTEGFDYETLWVIRDGRPRLKIFEN